MRLARARTAAVATAILLSAPVPACGPQWPDWGFVLETSPGPGAERFLSGDLGIVPARLGTADRIVLYRHLADVAPPEGTAELFAPSFLGTARGDSPAPAPAPRRWREAIVAAGGPDPGWIATARRRRSEGSSGGWLGLYPNCLDDAFETALETLAARTETWGAGSVWIREWLAGQSAVFANCGGGESTPSEPRNGWPELLAHDRRYQIAAAHLYSDRWTTARDLFAEIGRDTDSPWAPLARYLVGRTELRLDRPGDAAATFERVLADPQCQRWHGSARGLRDLARLRVDPRARGREIVADLLAPVPEGDIGQELTDLARVPGTVDPGSRFGRWFAVRTADQALSLWRAEPTAPSLALALALVPPGLAGTEELEHAAFGLQLDSPLALTAAWFRAAAARARGDDATVASILDPWLARDDLSISDRNRLSALRATAASNLLEYVRLSLARPVADRSWGGREIPLAGDPETRPERFPQAARSILEREVPLDGWLALAAEPSLPSRIRRAFALHGFGRAVVLERTELARDFAARLAELDPRAGEPLVAAARSSDPAGWRFATARALLETPGASLWLELERLYLQDDSPRSLSPFRQNWWCGGRDPDPDRLALPAFLRATERPAPAGSRAPGFDAAGVVLLGRRVLEYADARRDDPRVPEALHLVVRATRRAPPCPEADYGAVSRGAFERLHRRYPDNEWTARTPYWFDG